MPGIRSVRNPLPAPGGKDPETARSRAQPGASAVSGRRARSDDGRLCADCAAIPTVRTVAMRVATPGLYDAAVCGASGGLPVDESFLRQPAGLWAISDGGTCRCIDAPVKIPLDIRLTVGIKSGHFRGDVVAALSAALGPGTTAKWPGFSIQTGVVGAAGVSIAADSGRRGCQSRFGSNAIASRRTHFRPKRPMTT